MKHTKLPWKFKQAVKKSFDRKEDCLVYHRNKDEEPLHIAESFQYQSNEHNAENGTSIANAQFIVTACNNHYELLEALQSLYDEQNGPPLIQDKESWEKAMKKAEQAIKKAEAEL